MHACCKEGVASNRCVKLPTMSPLSHLWIDGLRGAEVRVREFGPLWHLHAFCCKHCGSVLGFPNTLCSGWRSFQLPEKLCAHLRSPRTPSKPLAPIWLHSKGLSRHSEDPVLLPGKATAPLCRDTIGDWHGDDVCKTSSKVVVTVLAEIGHL